MKGAISLLFFVLLVSRALACDSAENCRRCAASAFNHCIQYMNDPICEARKAECQRAPAIAPGGPSERLSPFQRTPTWANSPSQITGGRSSIIRDPGAIFHNGTTLALVPARSYLRATEIPPPSVAAYGIVAFRAKPNDANRPKLRRVCEAYKSYLPQLSLVPNTVPISDIMLTVWPVDNPSALEILNDDCGFAIEHYDLFAGLSAITDANKQGAKLDGEGPFLIGWSPSASRGLPDKVVLVVDLSGYESQESLKNLFMFWQNKVVQNPELWRSGFSIERFRLAVHDFVDRYGGDILHAAKMISGKSD